MYRRPALVAVISFLLIGVACGGSSTSTPTAPSPSSNGSAAVINGSVSSGQSSASTMSVRLPSAAAGMGLTVTIAGTTITTTVNSSGQFTLNSTAGGDIVLQFSGGGVSGTVDLSGVQTTETITLSLVLSGSSISLDTEQRHGGSQEQLEGLIQALPPTTAAGSFRVAGQTITTDGGTVFFHENGSAAAFSDLALGQRVHVAGRMSGSVFIANTVQIQNGDDDQGNNGNGGNQDQSASIDGVLTSQSGAIPNLTLLVGGTVVTTDSSTIVRRRGDVQPLSVLQVGMDLHVEGTRQANGSILARMLQIKDDATGGAFQISGSMGGVKGTCPSLQFVVNGLSIFTDGSTAFTPACSTFKSGTKVTVNGVTQADGSVKATSVTTQ